MFMTTVICMLPLSDADQNSLLQKDTESVDELLISKSNILGAQVLRNYSNLVV